MQAPDRLTAASESSYILIPSLIFKICQNNQRHVFIILLTSGILWINTALQHKTAPTTFARTDVSHEEVSFKKWGEGETSACRPFVNPPSLKEATRFMAILMLDSYKSVSVELLHLTVQCACVTIADCPDWSLYPHTLQSSRRRFLNCRKSGESNETF